MLYYGKPQLPYVDNLHNGSDDGTSTLYDDYITLHADTFTFHAETSTLHDLILQHYTLLL